MVVRGCPSPPHQQQMSPVAVLASVPRRADGPLTPEGGGHVRLRPEDDLFKCTLLISGVLIRLFLVFSHSSEHSPAPPDSKPVSFRSSCLRAVSTAHKLLGSICGYENRTFYKIPFCSPQTLGFRENLCGFLRCCDISCLHLHSPESRHVPVVQVCVRSCLSSSRNSF